MTKWPKQQVQFLYLVMTTSQIKYICLDFDGVISPGKYFSEIYAAKFGVAVEQLLPFFQHKKKLANLGQADMKQLLTEELAVWSGQVVWINYVIFGLIQMQMLILALCCLPTD